MYNLSDESILVLVVEFEEVMVVLIPNTVVRWSLATKHHFWEDLLAISVHISVEITVQITVQISIQISIFLTKRWPHFCSLIDGGGAGRPQLPFFDSY